MTSWTITRRAGSPIALALVAIPFLVALGVLDTTNWVRFRRVSHRIRSLERLLHAYVVALRELKTARPQALAELRKQVDRYQFGTERTIDQVTAMDVLRASWRLRPCLYALISLFMLLAGVLWVQSPGQTSPVCILTAGGGIARVDTTPLAARGSVTLVPCPASH